ncbi:MAG: hypothetical protein NZL96_02180 [Patescibacteria group bacterium]|nr:hypothetical protein [Patescibacteria group bacterium]
MRLLKIFILRSYIKSRIPKQGQEGQQVKAPEIPSELVTELGNYIRFKLPFLETLLTQPSNQSKSTEDLLKNISKSLLEDPAFMKRIIELWNSGLGGRDILTQEQIINDLNDQLQAVTNMINNLFPYDEVKRIDEEINKIKRILDKNPEQLPVYEGMLDKLQARKKILPKCVTK